MGFRKTRDGREELNRLRSSLPTAESSFMRETNRLCGKLSEYQNNCRYDSYRPRKSQACGDHKTAVDGIHVIFRQCFHNLSLFIIQKSLQHYTKTSCQTAPEPLASLKRFCIGTDEPPAIVGIRRLIRLKALLKLKESYIQTSDRR